MKPRQSLVDAAVERAAAMQEERPEKCHHCHGKGQTKGMFDSTWDCFHCDGTGYAGDSTSIAKWFRAVLIQRTQTLKDIRQQFRVLKEENQRLKTIFPDWEEKMRIQLEQEMIDKNRSRFD